MTLSYFLGIYFSLGVEKKWGSKTSIRWTNEAVLLGVAMGLLNFFGYYAFLMALSPGPLSAIALITSMHFVIAIIFSILIYQEKLSTRRSVGVLLALLTVFLLQ